MECQEARLLLDQGVTPGAADVTRTNLGFHLVGCSACRAHRAQVEHARLMYEIANRKPPVPLVGASQPPRPSRRGVASGLCRAGATLLVGGALSLSAGSSLAATRPIVPNTTLDTPSGVVANGVAGSTSAASVAQKLAAEAVLLPPLDEVPHLRPLPLSVSAPLAQSLAAEAALFPALNEAHSIGGAALPPAAPAADAALASLNALPASVGPESFMTSLLRSTDVVAADETPPPPAPPVELSTQAQSSPVAAQQAPEYFVIEVFGTSPQPGSPLVIEVFDPVTQQMIGPYVIETFTPQAQPAQPARRTTTSTQQRSTIVSTNYVVRTGDSLRAIAQRAYGNEHLWGTIYEANRGVIGRKPDVLQPGQRLNIPRAPVQPSRPQQVQPQRTYVVQPGDTLSDIALRMYGNANLWTLIYEANRNVIGSNPNLIYPRQQFTIPGVASQPQTPQTPQTGRGSGTYVVQAGDTLEGIALRIYGKAGLWEAIYRANLGIIGANPNILLPGWRLTLPSL